jgi:hypothetical protein
MITLFVGDNTPYLAQLAVESDSTAFLIHHGNWKKFLSTDYYENITIYTSFGDLPKITESECIFFEVLQRADSIRYFPPVHWSDTLPGFTWFTNRTITEYFLHRMHLLKNNVSGLDLSTYQNSGYLNLVDSRKTDASQLWIAGCSISHGVGVENQEKYGSLISVQAGMYVSFLTSGGSSIEWAKDQILRSDIRKGDIVIWGITQENRAPKIVNGKIQAEQDPDILLDETSLYRATTSVYQIVNFCNKISARLILLPLICSERLQLLIQHLPEFQQLSYRTKPLDYGYDLSHPGPLQHCEWAEICLERILKITGE